MQYSSHHTPAAVASESRAKCDQVVSEAIAKACEIAVRGRCTAWVGTVGGSGRDHQRPRHGYGAAPLGSGAPPGGGGARGRFNIEVDEVPAVRALVREWSRAPHAPLRLDIYYEHAAAAGGGPVAGGGDRAPPQRELLERWSIDYVPLPASRGASGGSAATPMSQLRQVCKRVVVMLRSLHCLTRLLPGYRLRCLLLSHMRHGGVVTRNLPGMMAAGPTGAGEAAGIGMAGWGAVGFAIHVARDYERGDPASSPSPSFARHALPPVPTPYGTLALSVAYDAALRPHHLVAEVAERRQEWLQRRWSAETPLSPPCGEGPPRYPEEMRYAAPQRHPWAGPPPPAPAAAATTLPILIRTPPPAAAVGGSSPQERRHNSCSPRALMAGDPRFSSPAGRRPRAVSDFIISDYHDSPKLSSARSHSPRMPSGITVGLYQGGNGGEKMSGLSLAMMNDQAHPLGGGDPAEHRLPTMSPGYGHGPPPPSNPQHAHQYAPYYACPDNDLRQHNQTPPPPVLADAAPLPFGSPAARAAFHNPPPGGGGGTHFFHKHAGYGYGYNGSNFQFGSEGDPWQEGPRSLAPRSSPPPLESAGTGSSAVSPHTPPTPRQWQGGTTGSNNKTGAPRSPSTTKRNNTSDSAIGSAAPSSFVNTSTHQQHPPSSPGGGSHRSGTTLPTTTPLVLASHTSDIQQQMRSNSRIQQSMQLLPPVTSLDVLQKSPFLVTAATRKTMTAEEAMLATSSSSSIPRMVSDERNCSGVDVSALGGSDGGDLNNLQNPLTMPPFGGAGNAASAEQPKATEESAQRSLAVNDDSPREKGATGAVAASSSSSSVSPSKRTGGRSLLVSTKADTLEGTLRGGGGGMAEITSSLALSSLHHRCSADKKVGLKMFEATANDNRGNDSAGPGTTYLPSTKTTNSNDSGNDVAGSRTFDTPSITDQLSDFKSFGESLRI